MLLVCLLKRCFCSRWPPTQRLDEHHGIVMDWARRGLE
jgi:hypothetical protein